MAAGSRYTGRNMIVYSGTKDGFMNDMVEDAIQEKVADLLYDTMHVRVSPQEYKSWNNSLHAMFKTLAVNTIPDSAGIAIEYNIPLSAKRVDFMISGYDSSKRPSIVVIELKQWERLRAVPGTDAIVETYLGGANRRTVHPSYQAWSYASLIRDFNLSAQEEQIRLSPCAFLHNYRRKKDGDPLDSPQYAAYLEDAPAFVKGEVTQLRQFIGERITSGDDSYILNVIEHGKIRPSKQLQDCIIQLLEGNPEFVLVDEQRVAYEEILKLARKSQKDGRKRTIIVEGGPGTGKSVVAVNLLARLTKEEQLTQYVSKATAPRDVYLRKLTGRRKSSVANLFRGSGSFIDAAPGSIDTLIVDEAHRLNAQSGLYHNRGENQIKEIIAASHCSVFFLDENQRVTLQDIGSAEEIESRAREAGAEIHRYALPSQFRCNGSNGYLAWLDNVLQIRPTANYRLEQKDYDFRVVDSPHELRRLIEEKDSGGERSRVVAGYCWKWPTATRSDSEVPDIIIDDFKMSWNLNSTTTYAIDETSVHEAGCIHTVQGLEFAYVGVIIGNDMRYADGCVVTDYAKRASTDQSLRGIKKLSTEDPEKAARLADEIIKNTYRTLMTRGLKGCFVYCTDPRLAEYLRKNAY